MSSPGIAWTILTPLLAGLLGSLLMAARRIQRDPETGDYAAWLRAAALLAVCAGLLLEALFLTLTPEGARAVLFGIDLVLAAPARYVLTAANVPLLCAALFFWTMPVPASDASDDAAPGKSGTWVPLALGGASALLTGVGLSTVPLISTLLLAGVALVVCLLALPAARALPTADIVEKAKEDDPRTRVEARAYAGALKHGALAVIATVLWIGGNILVERYGFNLENRGLLQFGVGLLAAGLLVWAGSMPFTASWGDLTSAAPTAALVALGAAAPLAVVTGLLLLSPVEGSLARGAAAGWLGAVGAVLAGLRALATVPRPQRASSNSDSAARTAALKAMTVAVAVAWAVYGVLSGSEMGAVGSILIATNIALAVPLLLVGERWAVTIGAASLLGLPPFGGFAGLVLVAQSAANSAGLWLALLLAGSALVGGSWLANRAEQWAAPEIVENNTWNQRLTDPVLLLTCALALVQIGLFLAAATRLAPLLAWANVPWLTAP